MAKIVEVAPIKLKNPILIEGFPGVGMIGTIAAMHLVKEWNMELVGYIDSEAFPPLCTVHNEEPLPAARIYQSKKHNVLVLFSEFVIPMPAVNSVANEIVLWGEDKKLSAIISLGGVGIEAAKDVVFGIASTEGLKADLKDIGVTIVKEGVTTGVTGLILANAYVRKFPAAAMLTSSRGMSINLIGAANVLDKLSQLLHIDIDTQKLKKEGEEIEEKIKKLIKESREAKKTYEQIQSPMYR
ncbi:MAG: PAC2 family protein [Candidatus Micrarchaeota archaeon]|nr:PAC2 family protein [Candidatus Micrarchaeota archaeon]